MREKCLSFKHKVLWKSYFGLLAFEKCFKHVYILNDSKAVQYYNKIYRTNVFSNLPDPYFPLTRYDKCQARSILGLDLNKTIFLHLGALSSRKGTVEILEALQQSSRHMLANASFVFVGSVSQSIRQQFYAIYEQLRNKIDIYIVDSFVDFPTIAYYLSATDFLLIPYKNTNQSSGMCAYSAQYKVPVLGPSSGLIGEIIIENELGMCLEMITPSTIADGINLLIKGNIVVNELKANAYLEKNTIERFCKILLDNDL